MKAVNINLSGANEPQKKNNNKVPNYLSGDNSSQQSESIFANNSNIPSVIGELEKQNKKLDNAVNEPVFKMSETEKQESEKLNKEHKSRLNYQEIQADLKRVTMSRGFEFGSYKGRIAGKDFSLKRSNVRMTGHKYEGTIDGQKVDVKETTKYFKTDGTFVGTIGNKKLDMKSERTSDKKKINFTGTYNGKSFTVQYKDNGRDNMCERTLKGKFDNQEVNINSKNTEKSEDNSIPKDFADVVSLIFVRGNHLNAMEDVGEDYFIKGK